ASSSVPQAEPGYVNEEPMSNRACVMMMLGSLLAVVACDPPAAEDGRDDSFLHDGKSDTGGITEGSPQGVGVLRVANELTRSQLDNPVALATKAADNIVTYRLGDDGVAATSDDQRFDTLAELDAVPYVGPIAFGLMLDYAQTRGWVVP